MGRLVLAGALLVAAAGHAGAGPTRKVQVQSDPEGAEVYLGDVESGALCETPCSVDAPIGKVLLIVRKDGFEPDGTELDVTKGKKALQQSFKLKRALGVIRVDSPRGASVSVDKEDKGKVPVEVPVPAGKPLHVVVTLNGKNVVDEIVEVETNKEYIVKPKTASAEDTTTVTDDPEDGGGDDGGEGGGGGGSSGGGTAGAQGITKRTTSKPRGAYISIGAAVDIGFRHVTYQGEDISPNLREEVEGGQVLAGPAIELWPGRMLGVGPLSGLSVFMRYQHPVVGQVVDGDLNGAVETQWQAFEASVRHRWVFGSIGVEVGGGYVQESLSFKFEDSTDRTQLPVVNYRSVRVGGKLAFVAPGVEPYVAVENRIVQSGGEMATRFDDVDIDGLRGSAGLLVRFGGLTARVEGTAMRYKWAITTTSAMPMYKAEGMTDSIQLISAFLGYSY